MKMKVINTIKYKNEFHRNLFFETFANRRKLYVDLNKTSEYEKKKC